MKNRSHRRLLCALAAGILQPQTVIAMAQIPTPHKRPIPRSGELLPIVGLGTFRTFDVGADAAARAQLKEVLNLLGLDTHLQTLREWKAAGKIRHLGITHYHSGAYDQLERLVKSGDYDFVQFNYSMDEREAESRLLPSCADSGTAVIVNRPFAQASLFGKVKGKPLPPWAAEFDCTSWAQFFLKYLLGHPAVSCVIPGTRRVSHLRDNLQAGSGRLPDAATRRRMVEYLAQL